MDDETDLVISGADDNGSITYHIAGNFSLINNDETFKLSWYRHNVYASAALSIAYGLVFIAGLVGNILVIIAVFSGGRSMRYSVINIFLANLAVADLLVIIACLPFTLVTHLITPWVLGATICKLLPFLQGVSVCASVYSLVAVAVERCRSITSPLKQRLTTCSCRLIIAIIWIAAIIITAPWLFVFQNELSVEDNFMSCTEVWPEPWMEVAYFSFAHLTLCYVVPLLVIVVSYAFVGHRIWKRQILGSHPSDEVNRQARLLQQSKLRALRMVAVVVGAFALAWLPLYATFMRMTLANAFNQWDLNSEEDINWWSTVIPIAQWMSSANSCVNPFLYHFFDPRFRSRFRQLLHCHQQQQQSQQHRLYTTAVRYHPHHHQDHINKSIAIRTSYL